MFLENLKKLREDYQNQGNILKEVEVLREIKTFSKENFGIESQEYIKSLNELGGTLKYIGFYDEAEKNINEAIEIISAKIGMDSLDYATTLLNLTEVYRYASKFNLLEENYKKIVSIYKKNNADKTFHFAGVCNNFGLFYQNNGDFSKAYDLHIESLEILKNLDGEEYLLEYAVTLSNLFNPCLQLGKKEIAVEYLNKSLKIFEDNLGMEHPLYAASLNNMAVYYFNERDLKNSLKYFELSAEISKKTMGIESDNYKNTLSNIAFIKGELETSVNIKSSSTSNLSEQLSNIEEKDNFENKKIIEGSEVKLFGIETQEKDKKIKGLELSKRYFFEIVYPAFKEKLGDIINYCTFGLVGEGSECYGYDDDFSQDHDFGASICVWLDREKYIKYKEKINLILTNLPKEFLGFKALKESEWGADRRGVLCTEDFYFKFLGQEQAPKTIDEWRKIPETALATAINGEIFLDINSKDLKTDQLDSLIPIKACWNEADIVNKKSKFLEIREELLNYYPEVIRQNKIATRLMNISQHGQYNYIRSLKRNDFIAANQALYLFVDEVIHLVALFNRKYKIFYKWSNRSLLDMEILGADIYKLLNDMVFAQNKIPFVKKICELIVLEIKKQNLSKIDSDFLGDFGVDIQKNIDDPFFKEYSPWLD